MIERFVERWIEGNGREKFRSNGVPTTKQLDEYVTLGLHIVQGLKEIT